MPIQFEVQDIFKLTSIHSRYRSYGKGPGYNENKCKGRDISVGITANVLQNVKSVALNKIF